MKTEDLPLTAAPHLQARRPGARGGGCRVCASHVTPDAILCPVAKAEKRYYRVLDVPMRDQQLCLSCWSEESFAIVLKQVENCQCQIGSKISLIDVKQKNH